MLCLSNRLLPFELELDSVACEVDNGNSVTDCKDYAPYSGQCIVDIEFNYTFTNIGLACVHIADVKADLASLGLRTVEFNDIYSYQERQMCALESWTIPDRRSSVNFCDLSKYAFDAVIDINESQGRMANLTFFYEWVRESTLSPAISSQPSSFPSLSNEPSLIPTNYPSMTPTVDTCKDCTLTGIISGGK